MLGRRPGRPTILSLKKDTWSWRLPCVRPKPILMTEGRQDIDAFSKTFFFSSMKSIDCSEVNIFSNNMGVVRSKDLKENIKE